MIPSTLRQELSSMWESLLLGSALTFAGFVLVRGLSWVFP
jgi:hypothetical protein